MSIWVHEDAAQQADVEVTCPYCSVQLSTVYEEFERGSYHDHLRLVKACSICGWWTALSEGSSSGFIPLSGWHGCVGAILRNLDISSETAPLDEVTQYLTAKFGERFNVHPQVFEETVASIYAGLKYRAVATSYRGDDGIDIFIERDGIVSGVQVKRTRNKIEAELIRSLTGSLVLNNLTRGVFVTASSFRRGAVSTAARFREKGYAVELVDADALFELLRMRQHTSNIISEVDCKACLDKCDKDPGSRGWNNSDFFAS